MPAPLLYVSKGQINAVVPFALPLVSDTEIQVRGTAAFPPLQTQVAELSPGVFYTDDLTYLSFSSAINQDGTLNAWYNPAPGGSIVTFIATGLGPIQPAAPDGSVPSAPGSKPEYQVIASSGQIVYVGDAPGSVEGITQINVLLPACPDSQGCAAGLSIKTHSGEVISLGGGATYYGPLQ